MTPSPALVIEWCRCCDVQLSLKNGQPVLTRGPACTDYDLEGCMVWLKTPHLRDGVIELLAQDPFSLEDARN